MSNGSEFKGGFSGPGSMLLHRLRTKVALDSKCSFHSKPGLLNWLRIKRAILKSEALL